jgi:Spy/CpxP family protein refolding chaperone
MKNKNLLMVALMITALIASGTMALAQDTAPPNAEKGPMRTELKLTEQQREKMAEMRTAHKRSSIDINAEMQKARLDLDELMKTQGNDDAVVAKNSELSALTAKSQEMRLRQQLEMRALFTPEQWKKVAPRFSQRNSGNRSHGRGMERSMSRGPRAQRQNGGVRQPREPRSPRTPRATRSQRKDK